MEISWLGPGDAELVLAAAVLFDGPPSPQWTERFLSAPGHHLALATVDGVPAGFVTGVEMLHPDKGTEMFLYELAVDEAYRRQGIGRALTEALRDRAAALGCYGLWVLTDLDNEAAQRTYLSAGGTDAGAHLMLDWHLGSPVPVAEGGPAAG